MARLGTVYSVKFAGVPAEDAHSRAAERFKVIEEREGVHLSNLVVQVHHEEDGSVFYYATTEVVEGA